MSEPLSHSRSNSVSVTKGVLPMVISVILLVGAIKIAAPILIPIAMALFLAILSLPLKELLERWKFPPFLAIALVVLLNLGVVVGLAALGYNLVSAFQSRVPDYIAGVKVQAENYAGWLEGHGIEGASEMVSSMDWGAVLRYAAEKDLLGSAATAGTEAVRFLVSILKDLMVIFLAMAFILIEATHIGPRFTAIRNSGGPDFSHLMQTVDDIQKYIGIKALISAVTGLLAGILCWVVGLEYAVLWGLIAFILNFIPVFGSIIAAIPATIVALLQFGFFQGAIVGLGYLAINQALGNLIEPMLMGLRFGVSTLVIFLSVIFWGWAWGPAGMFLAVPLTMVIKVSLDNTKDWRWISVAMGKKQVRGHDVLVADLLIDLETDGQTLGSGATTEWRKN